ncbi:MAG: GYF domain-containing protein [Xanthomonadaceae bacterium]|jgi:type IV pilus assembly protein PilA|nr:GYF domain-containing protein [Xanthomonadaceae bacterium]
MSIWHYATAEGQQFGPLSTEELTDLFHAGRIGLRTRVWRQGDPEWRLLVDFLDELGLRSGVPADSPVPPALPPTPQQTQASKASASATGVFTPPPASAPAPAGSPKKGLSGWAIFGIVAAIVGVFIVLPVAAIVAAIAIPAYQDSTTQAKISEIMIEAQKAKVMVAEFVAGSGRCPTEGDDVYRVMDQELRLSGRISSLELDSPDDYRCRLDMTIDMPGQRDLHGHKIWFEFDSDTYSWICGSDIPSKHMPAACRE